MNVNEQPIAGEQLPDVQMQRCRLCTTQPLPPGSSVLHLGLAGWTRCCGAFLITRFPANFYPSVVSAYTESSRKPSLITREYHPFTVPAPSVPAGQAQFCGSPRPSPEQAGRLGAELCWAPWAGSEGWGCCGGEASSALKRQLLPPGPLEPWPFPGRGGADRAKRAGGWAGGGVRQRGAWEAGLRGGAGATPGAVGPAGGHQLGPRNRLVRLRAAIAFTSSVVQTGSEAAGYPG